MDNSSFKVQRNSAHYAMWGEGSARGEYRKMGDRRRSQIRKKHLNWNTGSRYQFSAVFYLGKVKVIPFQGNFTGAKAVSMYKKIESFVRQTRPRGKVWCVNDRCPRYTSKLASTFLSKSKVLKPLLLPSRSPDLQPWDLTGFDQAKRILSESIKKKLAKKPSWTSREFVRMARRALTSKQVKDVMQRGIEKIPEILNAPNFSNSVL